MSDLYKKSSFKILGLSFSCMLGWDCYIVSIAKTTTRKIKVFVCSLTFLSSKVVVDL